MKVILDECLPKRLIQELPGHKAITVPMAGWAGIQNGELLQLIAGHFDAFVTIDGNLVQQQDIGHLSFGVIVLGAPSNKIEDIRPLIPSLLRALQVINAGQVCQIP